MLVSRGLCALRNLKKISSNVQHTQAIRNSHSFNYRVGPPPASKGIYRMADFVQGLTWWWVLWHLWTEPGHILGEFDYINPSTWTDEELGIS